MVYYTTFTTSLCEIILAGTKEHITHLHLNTGEGKRRFVIDDEWIRNDNLFSEARRQIEEYACGNRTTFSLPLEPKGTDFQKKVWTELRNIPYGEVRTYGDIASAIGNEKASRAVGMANGKNPIPLVIPCHRVIGANGNLVGFAQGIAIKRKLLHLEEYATK